MDKEILDKIEAINIISLKPGDTLVIKVDGHELSQTTLDDIKKQVEAVFNIPKHVKIVVMDKDMSIKIMRDDE